MAKFDPKLLPPVPDFSREMTLWERGLLFVGGVDEVGRGALAGPVAAGVVVFPADVALIGKLEGLRDSKKTPANERELWALRVLDLAVGFGVGFAWSNEIDVIGIVPATRLAMMRALELIHFVPQHLLIDYLTLPEYPVPQSALVKGDEISVSIAAASILAKVARDIHMCDLDGVYPNYGFANNKGYGTLSHREAINECGFCPIHRNSFGMFEKDI